MWPHDETEQVRNEWPKWFHPPGKVLGVNRSSIMPIDRADVVVIGAGVSGLSTAWYLARAGKDVVVVDKGMVGGEASGRNGGMISERVDEPDLIPMAVESLELWKTLDDDLGYPTEFIHQGRLQVAVTEEEMGDLYAERDVALRHGISVEVVDTAEIQ